MAVSRPASSDRRGADFKGRFQPPGPTAESFFATLKTELIHRRPWPTKAEAKAAVHDYIGAFLNPHRRHSSLGYLSPMVTLRPLWRVVERGGGPRLEST